MLAGLSVGLVAGREVEVEIPRAMDLFIDGRRLLPHTKRPNSNHHIGENMTITRILCGCALFAFAVATTSAQTKQSISGTCAKPDVQQSIPAGDQPGHSFLIQQGKCSAKGETAGAMSKEGVFSEHDEMTGNHIKAWGVYAETYDSGDKVFYNYQITATTKDGVMQSGKGTYQATGGTGKMKGIKGKGTCTYSPGTDGGSDYACTGEYTLAGAMAAK
jgi:hypothetical protein